MARACLCAIFLACPSTLSARFRRNPWFAATAVLTLALGLGAAVSIFTVVNRVLLAPLPYSHPDRLVWISTWNKERGQYSKSSGFDFNVWKQQTDTFDAVEAYWDRAYTITGTSRPEGLAGWQFTAGLFSLLGTPPALGRTFLPDEGQPGRDAVVVLSDDLWRRRFDARSTIVGDSIELDGRAHTIVGVMPPTFAHPYPNAQMWTPVELSSAALADRKQRPYRVVARLRDGVSRERAEVELRAIAERLAREHPDTHEGFSVAVRPLRDFYVGDTRPLLWVLQGTACVLLLIAVSNVASLLLVRDASRQRETAVRLALGASRLHLLRQHLAEGLALAGCGGAGGLLLALWGTQLLPRLLATRLRTTALPDAVAGWIDARVLIATAITVVVVGVMFGVTPLLRRTNGLSGGLAQRQPWRDGRSPDPAPEAGHRDGANCAVRYCCSSARGFSSGASHACSNARSASRQRALSRPNSCCRATGTRQPSRAARSSINWSRTSRHCRASPPPPP